MSELLSSVVAIQRRAMIEGELEEALRQALELLLATTKCEAALLRQPVSSASALSEWTTAEYTTSHNSESITSDEDRPPRKGDLPDPVRVQLQDLCNQVALSDSNGDRGETSAINKGEYSLLSIPLRNSAGLLVGVLGLAGNHQVVAETEISSLDHPLVDLCTVLVESSVRFRLQAQSNLLSEEKDYRHLLEISTEACFLFGDDARVVDVNPKACESLGYTRAELIGRYLSDFDNHFARSDVQSITQALKTEGPLVLESTHRRKDGSTIPVVIRTRRFCIEGDAYSIAYVTDLSDLGRPQEEVRDNRVRLQLALDASGMGVWEWDRETGSVYWSEVCLHLLKTHSLGDTIDSFLSLLHPEDADSFQSSIEKASPHDFGGVHEYRLLSEQGPPTWVECSFLVKPNDQKELPTIVGTLRDATERRRYAEQLQEVREEFSAIIEHSPVAVFVKDIEGRYTVVNQLAQKVLSNNLKAVGRTDRELLDPESARILREHDLQVLNSDQVLEFEDTVERNGFSRTFLAVKFPLHNAQGKPRALCGIATDITERLQSERKLRLAQFCVDKAAMIVLRIGSDARILYANEKACENLQYAREELLEMTMMDISDNTEESFLERFRQVKQHGSLNMESDYRRRDGSHIPVETTVHYDQYEGEEYIFAFSQDITERKQAERKLRLNQKSVDHAAFGVFWIRRDGSLRYVNDWVCKSLGYTREELLSMSMPDFAQHDPESWSARFEQVKQLGSFQLESTHRRRDGTIYPVQVTAHYDEYEGEEYLFAFTLDITERREAEKLFEEQSAELLHASRLSVVGQMVAGLSHEVAQPLSAVGNFAAASLGILKKEGMQESQLGEYIEAILKQNYRCGEILKRLRDFSRTAVFRRSDCRLADILEESVKLVANELSRHEVHVNIQIPADLPEVHVDRVQIQQVVVNLLTNARDAMRQVPVTQREIDLRAFEDEHFVGFSVRDRGSGLAEEEADKLFDAFYTTKEQGMGLGLSICQTIVYKHNGRIEAHNDPRGGASFTVSLPKTHVSEE